MSANDLSDTSSPALSEDISWDVACRLLKDWLAEVTMRETSHAASAKRRSWPNWVLSVLSAILNGAIGVSFFTGWQEQGDLSPLLRIVIIAMTFAAAIFSALGTSLNLRERSERHLKLANDSRALRIEISYLLACPPQSTELRRILDSLKERMAALGIND